MGGVLSFEVCRGGRIKAVDLRVDDLHALTPGRYFEVGGGVVNELSYQQARNHGIPARGVYVAHPGYMLRQGRISRGSVIDSVNGVPTPDLESFITAMAARSHGDPLTVRFFDVAHRSHVKLASLTMDRKWFPTAVSQRTDPRFCGAEWSSTELSKPTALAAAQPSIVPTATEATAAVAAITANTAMSAATAETTDTAVPVAAAATAYASAPASVWQPSADGVWRATTEEGHDEPTSDRNGAVHGGGSSAPVASAAADGGPNVTGPTREAAVARDAPAVATAVVHSKPVKSPAAAGEAKENGAGASKGSAVNVGELLRTALVTVDFTRPFSIDGETGMRYRGAGLVLDAAKGIVAVDRNTVTSTLGDVLVTVGDAASLPATVLYVHPVHNFALVQYDPAALPAGTKVSAAKLDSAASLGVSTGMACWLVGLKSGLNEEFDVSRRVDLVARKTRVANAGWIKLPLPNPPRYQLYNVETLGLEVAPSLDGGVIATPSGAVTALWTSCTYHAASNQVSQVFRGLPAHHIASAADHLIAGRQPPRWQSLGVTLEPLSTAAARRLGAPESLLPTDGVGGSGGGGGGGNGEGGSNGTSASEGTSVLCITHVQSNSPARDHIRGGDLLLRVGGQPVRSIRTCEAALQGREAVDVQIVRDGQPLTVHCPTLSHDGLGTSTVVGWAGLLLQEAPEAVQSQRSLPVGGGVYASYRFFGSPSSRYDLAPTSHIIEVDSTPTPTLEAFLSCTRHKRDGEVLRLKYVDLEGRRRMTTLKLDLKYWPTFLLTRDKASGEWERSML